MNSAKLARATFVINRDTSEQLGYLSSRMGVSRSELVREMLAEPVDRMAGLLGSLPEQPTEADIRQLALSGLGVIEEIAGPKMVELRAAIEGHDHD